MKVYTKKKKIKGKKLLLGSPLDAQLCKVISSFRSNKNNLQFPFKSDIVGETILYFTMMKYRIPM